MSDTPMDDPQQPAPSHISPFERIRQTVEDGSEFWSARDLASVLGYQDWRNFDQAVERDDLLLGIGVLDDEVAGVA
jgi:prophage antirepressor-like protein